MEQLAKAGRIFFGIGLIGIAIQHFMYSEFRPVILPPWPEGWQSSAPAAWVFGVIFGLCGLLLVLGKNTKNVSLILGGIFLFLSIAFQLVFTLFTSPNSPKHFGVWTDPLKEFAMAGQAFIISMYPWEKNKTTSSPLLKFLENIAPFGKYFFATMLIIFGIDHFVYTDFVATLVPDWLPGHVFWTYLGAIALIGAGLAIFLNFQMVRVNILLGLMLFIWFLILHIPRGIADPNGAKGNEITSVFEALAFSGAAFVLAATYKRKLSAQLAKA
ncbi:MAG: hypothetical protein C5B52_17675 [Bacteroidetes bacterium]|nr:MAG: hypothetical protein C5B52_17675 [Bacteroidota bacterium]